MTVRPRPASSLRRPQANEYSAAYKNLWGTDLSLTSNPDYGIVGSPSSYSQTLSVASADNVTVRSAYFEAAGRKITFTDTATTNNPEGGFIRVLGGKTLDYVVVPGSGEEADYANLNVKGKVVLVSRGVTTFAEKHEMAHAKGAAACIVYNTEAGHDQHEHRLVPDPCDLYLAGRRSGDGRRRQGRHRDADRFQLDL